MSAPGAQQIQAGGRIDPLVVFTLMGCVAMIGANSLVLGPISPAIALRFETTAVRVLLGSSCYGLATAFSAFMLAPMIDRIGPRRGLLFSVVGLGVGMTLSALAPDVETLIAAQGIAGLSAGVALPAIYSLATIVAPPGKANTVLGRVMVGWTISLVAGVSLSALVADLFHWRYVFAFLALLSLCTMASLWQLAPDAVSDHKSPSPSPMRALGFPGVISLLCLCFAFMSAFYGTYAYIGDHIVSAMGLPVRAGALVAVAYGTGFGLGAFGDPWLDRVGPRRLMAISLFSVAIVYLMMGLTSAQFWWLVIMSFLWGLVNHAAVGIIVGRLAALDPKQRGTILGLQSAVTYIAVSVGTFAYGRLYRLEGFTALCLLSALLLALAALYAMRMMAALSGDSAAGPG